MVCSRLVVGLVFAGSLGATSYNCAFLSINGASSFTITGINTSGVVSGTYITGSTHHGFEMNTSGSGLQTFDYPGASQTNLYAINNKGVAVGAANQAVQGQTTTWFTVTSTGTYTTITVPSPYVLDMAYGINDNGAISAIVGQNGNAGPGFFAILNPNGTVTVLNQTGSQSLNSPGSIDNSLQMLESDHFFGQSDLVNAGGNVTPIIQQGASVYAFGLNNGGIVAGYISPSEAAGEGPYYGFTWDSSSGTFSQLMCPGIFSSPTWLAINDNGVAAGGTYYATPLPGQPQVSLSTTSLNFPPTPVGQTSAPQDVTITNTGNQRLDIASIFTSTSVFRVSGCLDPNTQTASLNPGAACTLSVTATPGSQGQINGTITINDSAPGSRQIINATVTGTAAPPTCQISSVNLGPPEQVSFTFQDQNSGLQSIVVTSSSNAQTNVPTFVSGTTLPQTATATQVDTSTAASANFTATNISGGAVSCGATFGGPSNWIGIGGYFTSKVAAANNTDGSVQIFVRGSDNALWTNQQAPSGGGWSGWTSLGGSFASDPVVGTNSNGTVEAFVRGPDGSIWTIAETGPGVFGGWQGLGGYITSNPTVVANPDGTLAVFAVGGDTSVWTISQTTGGGWGSWTDLGGSVINDPAVIADPGGLLHVFVLGGDNALWTASQGSVGGNWSGWTSLGGTLTGDPAAVIGPDGGIELFIRDLNNPGVIDFTWQYVNSVGGSGWPPLNQLTVPGITSDPAGTVNSFGVMQIVFRGPDNALWFFTQQGSNRFSATWTSPASIGGGLAGAPAVLLNPSGLGEAFVQGTDHTFWFITQAAPGYWN